MKLVEVKVIPKSSRQRVETVADDKLKAWIHSAPEKGKANDEVRRLLADYFDIPRCRVKLIKGEHSRIKIFSLDIVPDSRKIGNHDKED